jgi:hypothetical protein
VGSILKTGRRIFYLKIEKVEEGNRKQRRRATKTGWLTKPAGRQNRLAGLTKFFFS